MNACTNSTAACQMSANCDVWFTTSAGCGMHSAPVVAMAHGAEIGWVESASGFFARHFGCIRTAA
jgi:hypothetical protein